MPENNKHIKQYTAADIQRYVNRQMPAEERHALEKAALDDPFLAEAIEGYTQHASPTVLAELNLLKKSIREKAQGSKKDQGYARIGWSAAAAVLIVLGAALSWYWLTPSGQQIARKNTKTQKTESAKETKSETTSASEATPADTIVPLPPAAEQAESNTSKKSEEKTQTIAPAASPQKEESSTPAPSLVSENIAVAPAKQSTTTDQVLAREIPADVPTTNRKRKAGALSNTQPMPASDEQNRESSSGTKLYLIAGKISDNRMHSLPFVNIRILHTAKHTYSDAAGNFKLFSGDSSLTAEIKAVGFTTRQVVLQAGVSVNNIVLLPEVQTLARATNPETQSAKKKTIAKVPGFGENPNAEPVDGWGNYATYLINNTQVPQRNAGSQGLVDLVFTVAKNGSVSNFSIKHSTCPTCNKEAIRVVKEGPGWRITNNDNTVQVALTIAF